jgi:hypothetical protein
VTAYTTALNYAVLELRYIEGRILYPNVRDRRCPAEMGMLFSVLYLNNVRCGGRFFTHLRTPFPMTFILNYHLIH